MSWIFNPILQIAAIRCDSNKMVLISNNSRIIIQSATCNTSKNEMNLQIEPVQLADDGNYTCEILDQRGVHRLTFSLAVTVPPDISFSIENKLDDTMVVICTASNGKPAAEITWYPNNLGNFSIDITHHSNRTTTVQSKYHINILQFSEEISCIVSHPAFDGTKNYTIPRSSPALHDSQSTAKILFNLYVIAGVLVAFLCLLAVVHFTLRYFDLQVETAFRNCCASRSSQDISQSNGPFIQMENFIYDSFQPQKLR
ncbi:cell surface glycoprotein CD200 receptor 2-like [Stegostoma tigrinum]|uniref:cell surface glycoprotein CD200 receptor 2-like n=1 Tax=Stegostoma tigrinum TaxID=3053191 RepID=UPI00287025A5|nr:cell surface glycoprotein CD200 receptor 2-like [Stegostoma tigrinum]